MDASRHLAVLELATARSHWGKSLRGGHASGVVLYESFGSIAAQVAEVFLIYRRPRVNRVVWAMNCGTVGNLGIVAQPIEGAVTFALAAALYRQINIHEGVCAAKEFAGLSDA